ncbi:MAG: hypothetical protein CMM48_12960 [Rhodospirillaceae bacterium]|nr:hypothetical protein [Rhodospirillaceae bacterium]
MVIENFRKRQAKKPDFRIVAAVNIFWYAIPSRSTVPVIRHRSRLFMRLKFCLLVVLLAGVAFSAPARADRNVLSEKAKAALMAAKPVRGAPVNRQIFDGKPVLVVFFASW